MSRFVAAVAVLLVVVGCSPAPQLTREQYNAETTHTYSGQSPARVLAAAEELLRLIDPKKTSLTYRDGGVTAVRNYFSFQLIAAESGTATWSVDVADSPGGAVVTIQGSQQRAPQSFVLPATSVYDVPLKGNAAYRLFFSRLDYLLGLSPTWIPCYQASSLQASGSIGPVTSLCIAAPDEIPQGPVP